MRRLLCLLAFLCLLVGAVPVAAYGNPVSDTDWYPCPQGYPIKGNISYYGGQRIYHIPGGDYYNVTNPEQCFATEADAQ
jgi:hypothetical protein